MDDVEHEDDPDAADDDKNYQLKTQEQQYAEWLAACRLAAKGKTLADSR